MHPARNLLKAGTIALVLALTACSSDDPETRADAAPTADDATSAPPSETPAGDEPTDLVDLKGPLEAGTYSLAAWGETNATGPLPRAIVEVPEGYFSNGGYTIDAGHDDVTDDQYGDVWVWHVLQVPSDPCRQQTAADAGTSVKDLARALVDQAGPSTQPKPVVLDGHRGLTLQVTVPPGTDLSRCTNGEYSLWQTERHGDSALTTTTPGLVNRLWILDVDGTRLVLAASLYPDESAALHQEQTAIAKSVRFEPAPPA